MIDNLSEALNKNKIEYTVENLKKKKEDIIEKLINKRGVDREKLKTALECDLHCEMERTHVRLDPSDQPNTKYICECLPP